MDYLDALKKQFKKENKVELLNKYLSNISLNEDEIIDFLKIIDSLNFNKEKLSFILKNEGKITKRYYDFAPYKINALIENHEDEKAIQIILNELELPYIPTEFEIFLKETLNTLRQSEQRSKNQVSIDDLLKMGEANEEQIFSYLSYLKYYNLEPFYRQLQTILLRNDISNELKSLLLALLADMKINYAFQVKKNQLYYLVNPSTSKDFRDYESFKVFFALIEKHKKDMAINEIEYFKMIGQSIFLDIYPEEPPLEDGYAIFYAICKFLENGNHLTKQLKMTYLKESISYPSKIEYYYQKIVSLF